MELPVLNKGCALAVLPHSKLSGCKLCKLRCRYGFMPHRVAFWIYWQALRLLWMGVPFFGYPPPESRAEAEKKATNPVNCQNSHFVWRAPLRYPWNAM